MTELLFVEKRGSYRGTKDVSVSIGKDGNVNMTFRNETYIAIAPNTGHCVYAVADDKIYFKEADERKGFKFTGAGTANDGRYISFSKTKHNELTKWVEENEGDYDLKWDTKLNMWFICKNNLLFVTKRGET